MSGYSQRGAVLDVVRWTDNYIYKQYWKEICAMKILEEIRGIRKSACEECRLNWDGWCWFIENVKSEQQFEVEE